MSVAEGVQSSLASMGFIQLVLAFVAITAYSVGLNAAFGATTRLMSAAVALLGASGFAAATPSWMSGVVLAALGVAGLSVFAGAAWLISELFGVRQTPARGAASAGREPERVGSRPAALPQLHEPVMHPLG